MSSALPGRELTEHTISTARHTTGHIASGREDGPLMIFVHGWPELSLSWRHQLPCFASLGFRAVAPDLRGYGRSSVYRDTVVWSLASHHLHRRWPFAQTKEQLGGFFLIEAKDIDEACAIAARFPPARVAVIEVRPVQVLKHSRDQRGLPS